MRRPLRRTAVAVLLLPPLLLATAAPAAAHDGDDDERLPATYRLNGDPGGSLFEGIAVESDGDTFYVTEITGGEIHRGEVDERRTEVWLDERAALAAGRRVAVGVATGDDRVFVAGGDNRIQVGAARAPDFWVHDEDGELLAAVRMPVEGPVFLNDVVVGPDGAAYVTDSVTPRIFRIAQEDGGPSAHFRDDDSDDDDGDGDGHGDGRWTATLWADAGTGAGGPIEQIGDFGLNGIEVAPDGRSLIVAQSDVGALWRFDLETATPTRIDTGDVDLTSTDGMVVKGNTLVAVRNFPHLLTYLRLDDAATSARLLAEVPTDPNRLFTTGDVAEGRLLLVDSQFDENPPSQDSEVVARPFRLPRG